MKHLLALSFSLIFFATGCSGPIVHKQIQNENSHLLGVLLKWDDFGVDWKWKDVYIDQRFQPADQKVNADGVIEQASTMLIGNFQDDDVRLYFRVFQYDGSASAKTLQNNIVPPSGDFILLRPKLPLLGENQYSMCDQSVFLVECRLVFVYRDKGFSFTVFTTSSWSVVDLEKNLSGPLEKFKKRIAPLLDQ